MSNPSTATRDEARQNMVDNQLRTSGVNDWRILNLMGAIAREDFVADQSRRLIDELFGGRAAPLVAHLARRNALAPEDVAEIEELLKAIKS